jgi:hypothetical protein
MTCAAVVAASGTFADDYPVHPTRVVVPEEYAVYLDGEMKRWATAAEAAGLKKTQ